MTPEIDPNLVREAPRSTAKLLRLLRRGLRWNIPSDQDLDDILIDWSPEELNLNPRVVSRLTSIKQIPPLSAAQDFGVFILNFRGGQLPEPAIKRVVDRLVKKQRRARGSSQHPIWELGDLLFFCQNDGNEPSLHIVTFNEIESKPVVKVLGWGIGVSDARVDLLVNEYLPALIWPERQEDLPQWKLGLGRGFVASRQTITDSRNLARQMAETARVVRDSIRGLYEVEAESGPIRQLFAEIRENLADDLDPERFADMFAQTMVYGLLTSRIINREEFELDATATAFRFDNPFLDAVYREFREKSGEAIDVDELGLADLTELLNRVDVESILADFGDRTRRDDPVVYFYEEFISVYDPSQQVELGVYYTPIPVVQYIIRTVDETLKRDFGLPLGVADSTSWGEIAARTPGLDIPVGVTPDQPFVSMLDPATGTGTFLVEWIEQAERNVLQWCADSGLDEKKSREILVDALENTVIPQMAAFEITMASYAVAHLKVSMALPEELRGKINLPIYLTNTLEPPLADSGSLVFGDDPISRERERADFVKDVRVATVVVGNPPYRERARGHGGIVERSAVAHRMTPSLDDFRLAGGGRLDYKLHNLNVYFWRWSLWKAIQQTSYSIDASETRVRVRPLAGGGIVSFITTSPYINSDVFRGMRNWIRENATEAYVVDCTPEGHQPNVPTRLFPGVQQPLAIMTVVRRPCLQDKSVGQVRYRRVEGSREEKMRQLDEMDLAEGWSHSTTDLTGSFMPQASDLWASFASLGDLLDERGPGWKPNRSWVRAPAASVLKKRWQQLVHLPTDEMSQAMVPTRDRDIFRQVRPLPGFSTRGPLEADREPVEEPLLVGWRAFDFQYLIPDSRVLDVPCPNLWHGHFDKQTYLVELHTEALQEGPGLVFTHEVPASSLFKGSGGGRTFSCYLNHSVDSPNFKPGIMSDWLDHVGVQNPTEWVDYIAAVAGMPYFQERFKVELQTPGIRIPLTLDRKLFDRAVDLGSAVLSCYTRRQRGGVERVLPSVPDLLEGLPRLDPSTIDWQGELPSRMEYDAVRQCLKIGGIRVENVTQDVFEYKTSGVSVLRKWFGYRKLNPAGRASSILDTIFVDCWQVEWTRDLEAMLSDLAILTRLDVHHRRLLDEILSSDLKTFGE